MDELDLAFFEWATKRHKWLWRLTYSRPSGSRSRQVLMRCCVRAMELDHAAWRFFEHLRPPPRS